MKNSGLEVGPLLSVSSLFDSQWYNWDYLNSPPTWNDSVLVSLDTDKQICNHKSLLCIYQLNSGYIYRKLISVINVKLIQKN